MGKSTISTGPFSIAMLVYQRVPKKWFPKKLLLCQMKLSTPVTIFLPTECATQKTCRNCNGQCPRPACRSCPTSFGGPQRWDGLRAGHCFKEGQENIEKPMFGRYIMIYLWLLWLYIYIYIYITMVIADVSIVNYDLWYLTMVYIYIYLELLWLNYPICSIYL